MSDRRAGEADARIVRLGGGLDRSTMIVAGVATLGLIMAVLDTTIVNVALDTLSRDLHAPLSTIQWVSTGYLLTLASVIPLSGWITERFGSKRTWIASIALFAFGSALCAFATSAGELIAFRVLQGLGGGMLVPVGFTLVAQSAGPQRIGRALALIGVPILLGPIFGPIIGGLIVDDAPWQWIFVVNVPIAAVAIVAAARLLQADAGRADAGALDWVGAALLSPGLAGIVFGLSETESHGGINHPIAFGPIIAGLALVGLFVWHSLRVARPLIDLRLFRSRGFRAATTLTFLLGGSLFGTLLILPLYYQVDRGDSALNAGLLLAPQGLGAAAMLPLSGRLTDRIGGGPVAVAGCSLIVLATLPLAFVTSHTPFELLGVVLFVRGLGFGASIQPSVAAAYALLNSSQVPRATAALNTVRQIGGSIGTALLAVVLQHQATAHMASAGGAGGLLAPISASQRAQIGEPLATAFGHTFIWSAGMSVLALLAAVVLLRSERETRTSARAESSDPERRVVVPRGSPGGVH
jgi:EmrB/QacA subfamily drug resistance transporter